MAGASASRAVHSPQFILKMRGQRIAVPVSRSPFSIGRREGVDLVLNDARISRNHATVAEEEGHYYISDDGSRNGTFVNGEKISRKELQAGDRITFGAPDPELIFHWTSPSNITDSLLNDIANGKDVSDLGKLTLFLQAARALKAIDAVEDVFGTFLHYALQLTGAERGFVYVRDHRGEIKFSCGRDSNGLPIEEQSTISRSVLTDAFNTGADFVVGDAMEMSMLAERLSIVANELRTVIAIPLRASSLHTPGSENTEKQIFAVLYLDSHFASERLSNVSHDILRTIGADAAALIENARLAQIEQAAARYRQELEIANSIQQSLVPARVPDVSFARLQAHTVPCTEVGGDFYDLLVVGDSIIGIVADVSGKGVSAALLASVIQGMLYSQLSAGVSLTDAVQSVNSFLCSRIEGRKYATLVVARLAASGDLELVNCGHIPPIIVENGCTRSVGEGDLPVGLFGQAEFHAIRTKLAPDATLILLTDGICEAEDPEGHDFASAALNKQLLTSAALDRLFFALEEFCHGSPAQDDRTAMAIHRRAA